MTDELRRKLERLRDAAPRLNAATDEAARIVHAVEKSLKEMSLGVSAESAFSTLSSKQGEKVTETISYLAYGRVDGVFCVTVLEDLHKVDDDGNWAGDLRRTVTPWTSCDRETKLVSFLQLPDLLDRIAQRVVELSAKAEKTIGTIRDLGISGDGLTPLIVGPVAPDNKPAVPTSTGRLPASTRAKAFLAETRAGDARVDQQAREASKQPGRRIPPPGTPPPPPPPRPKQAPPASGPLVRPTPVIPRRPLPADESN